MSSIAKYYRTGTAVIALSASLSTAAAAADADRLATANARLTTLLPQLLSQHNVPGVSYAVADSSGVLLSAAFGEARPDVLATPSTLFNVASVTKLISAETVLQLAAQGKFDLDAPMAPTWIDPDIVEDPRHKQLTPRHALAHQTGFPNWRASAEDGRLAFQFDPGTRPGYSGEGFEYVARFAERRTDAAFPELAHSEVFEPAGVTAYAFGQDSAFENRLAWSMKPDGSFTKADQASSWRAADDLYISAPGTARILARLLGAGSLPPDLEKDRRSIQYDMTAQFCGNDAFKAVCPNGVGFGLSGIVFEYDNQTVYWQAGGDVGERAIAFYVPARDLAVVIFANGNRGGKLFAPIAAEFYDNPKFVEFLRIQGQRQ